MADSGVCVTDYCITAERREDVVRLVVAGYGVTTCARLSQAREAVAALLAASGRDLGAGDRLVFRLAGDLGVVLEHARDARDRAAAAQLEAAISYRRLVHALVVRGGFSQADIAAILDVSPQRVSQLVRA